MIKYRLIGLMIGSNRAAVHYPPPPCLLPLHILRPALCVFSLFLPQNTVNALSYLLGFSHFLFERKSLFHISRGIIFPVHTDKSEKQVFMKKLKSIGLRQKYITALALAGAYILLYVVVWCIVIIAKRSKGVH